MQLSYGSIERNRLPASLVDRFYIFSLSVFHFFSCRSFPRRSLTVVRTLANAQSKITEKKSFVIEMKMRMSMGNRNPQLKSSEIFPAFQ